MDIGIAVFAGCDGLSPPVLVGGNGPGTEDRVLAFGDGWLPQCGPLESVAELERRAVALRQRAADAGRGHVPITLFGVPPKPELVEAFAAAGVDRCLFPVINRDGTKVLDQLDQYAQLRRLAAAPPSRGTALPHRCAA